MSQISVVDMIEMGFPNNMGGPDLIYELDFSDLVCAKCAANACMHGTERSIRAVHENDSDYDCDWCGRLICGPEDGDGQT